MSAFFIVLSLCAIAIASGSTTISPTTDATDCNYTWSDIELIASDAKWTHLVYMLADNDLDRNSAQSLSGMRLNKATNDELNLVVYIDRSTRDDQETITNITDCNTNEPIPGLFTGSKLLQKQGDIWCQIYDFNECELDSLQSDNIASFVALMAQYQQSSTYFVLTLWDHGGAWMGFGAEDDKGLGNTNDGVVVSNLDTLFSAIKSGLQQTYIGRLDILGFDACIMADYSVLYYASSMDVSQYFIASEVPEPADNSWEYTAIDADATTAIEYAAAIVNGYVEQGDVQAINGGYTLAVFDMDKVTTFINAFNVLMRIATFAIENGDYGMLMAILRGERSTISIYDDVFAIYDLGLFLDNCITDDNIFWKTCNERVKTAGNNVLDAFEESIVYFRADFMRLDLDMTGSSIFFSTNPEDIKRFSMYNSDLTVDNYIQFLYAMNQTLESIKGGETSLLTQTICTAEVPSDLEFAIGKDIVVTYYDDIGLYQLELDITSTVMNVDIDIHYVYMPVSKLKGHIVDNSFDETKLVIYWDGKISNFVNLASDNDTDLAPYIFSTAQIVYDVPNGYMIKYPLYIFDADNYADAMSIYQAGGAKSGYIQYEVLLDSDVNDTVVSVNELILYEIDGTSGVISVVPDTEARIIVGLVSTGNVTDISGVLRWPELELQFETVVDTTTFMVSAYDVFQSTASVEISFDDLNVSTKTFFVTTTSEPIPAAVAKCIYYEDIGFYKFQFDIISSAISAEIAVDYTYVPIATLEGGLVVDEEGRQGTFYWDNKMDQFSNLASEDDDLSEYMLCTTVITYDFPNNYTLKYPVYIADTDSVSEAEDMYKKDEGKWGYIEYKLSMIDTTRSGLLNYTVSVKDLKLYESDESDDISEIPSTEERMLLGIIYISRGNSSETTGTLLWPKLELIRATVDDVTLTLNEYERSGIARRTGWDFDEFNITTERYFTTTTAPIMTEESKISTIEVTTSEESSTKSKDIEKESEKGLNAVDGAVWLIIVIVLVVMVVILSVLFAKARKELSDDSVDGLGYVQMAN